MLGVTVLHLRLAGRGYRIEVGDWLEKQNTNAGGRKTLAKCTATAYSKEQMRPKLRDWDDSKCKWGREHMVYDDHADYKVVTEQAARALAEPEAFNEGL
jgi:ATP:corrinoid adenosyltransferase